MTVNGPDSPAVKYVAIDPGETTGWATFNEKGQVVAIGQFVQADQSYWLQKLITSDLLMVIVEDYRNHAWKRQKNWSRNQTSKNIGAIEMMCDLQGVPITLQPNTVKSMGYMYTGTEPPKNHDISHQYDAHAHGIYWLQNNGVRRLGESIPND